MANRYSGEMPFHKISTEMQRLGYHGRRGEGLGKVRCHQIYLDTIAKFLVAFFPDLSPELARQLASKVELQEMVRGFVEEAWKRRGCKASVARRTV